MDEDSVDDTLLFLIDDVAARKLSRDRGAWSAGARGALAERGHTLPGSRVSGVS